MFGFRSRNSPSKQSRRLYLFALLSSVFFLAALFLFPQSSTENRMVSLKVELNQVDNPDVVKDLVVDSIKKQLQAEQLSTTLKRISESTSIKSRVLNPGDIEQVRNNLMGGALNLAALDLDTVNDSSGGNSSRMAFSISLKGSGTNDEVEFVRSMAEKIRNAVEPSTIRDEALAKLSQIQSNLREANSLSDDSQKGIASSLDKYVSQQSRLFTSSDREFDTAGTAGGNWELKNLTEQRRLTFAEYQANEALEFEDKAVVQDSLKRRIEYLDQEIDRLRKESSRNDRVAANATGVEKASFVESPSSTAGANDQMQSLKADMALVVNKMVLAQNSQKATQRIARQLSSLLQQNQMQVSISKPELGDVNSDGGYRIWLMLMASGVLGGLIVLRIDARAFATLLQDEKSVESALNLPVIGRVELPQSDADSRRNVTAQSRWVSGAIKICELVLVIAFLLFVAVLWTNSDISLNWLNDPMRVLKSSFR